MGGMSSRSEWDWELVARRRQADVLRFGPGIAGLFSALVALSLMSAVNAMVTIGPRVYYAMAKNGAFLPHFAMKQGQTYDPSGRGIKLNGLSKWQWYPQGAAGCVAPRAITLRKACSAAIR